MMSTADIRAESHELLDRIDERFLVAVHALLSAYEQQASKEGAAILGYEVDGKPITRAAFLAQAEEAMAEVERGDYVTLDELEKESESWLKRTE